MPLISTCNRQNAFSFTSSGDVEDVKLEAAGVQSVSLALYVQYSSTNIVDGVIAVGGHCLDITNDFYPFDDFEISGADFVKNGNLIEFPGPGDYKAIVTFKNPPKWLVLRTEYSAFTSGQILGGFSWSRS